MPSWWRRSRSDESGKAAVRQLQPSLLESIQSEIDKTPDRPIDESRFPKIGPQRDGISFSAGACDALAGRFRSAEGNWTEVRNIFHEIHKGKIQNWKVLEGRIGAHGVSDNSARVLESLSGSPIHQLNPKLFRELAQNSCVYEAVKWGIVVGAIDAAPEFMDELLIFARHSEFTVYAVGALLRFYATSPDLREKLLALLPVTSQWGVIQLIELVLAVPEFAADPAVQRLCLIFGMENNDGIPMEIAFTLASHINIYYFLELSASDRRVFTSFSQMTNTLLTDRAPLGGLLDLPEPEKLFVSYISLLENQRPDGYVLASICAAGDLLRSDEVVWSGKEELKAHVSNLMEERMSIEVLTESLTDPVNRWVALSLIREHKIKTLLPNVEALFLDKPDPANIQVLGELGGNEQLQKMFLKIPDLVDLAARDGRVMSDKNVIGPDNKNAFEYAGIVRTLGRLGTVEAISHLKRALRDYDPLVRAAACEAVKGMDRSKIDLEVANRVEERLNDPLNYVVEAARQAAACAGISLHPNTSNRPN